MDVNTPITTAARRISRELSAGTTGIDYLFTFDGTCVGTIQSGMWWGEGETPEFDLRLAAGKTTQRAMQDRLDAATAHPGDRTAQDYFLNELERERTR